MTTLFWNYLVPVTLVGAAAALVFLAAQGLLQRLQIRLRLWVALAATALFVLPLPQFVPRVAHPAVQLQYMRIEPIAKIVTTPVELTQANSAITLYEVLPFVWLLGVLLVLSVSIVRYVRFVHMLRKASTAVAADTARKLWALYECNVKSTLELRVTTALTTPVSVGFLHPCVYIPAALQKNEGLPYALRHECMHIKHQHILCKLLVHVICAVQWFNPLVWLMQVQVTKACEYTCDELVTVGMDETQRHAYGMVLLACATPMRVPHAANAFGGAAKQLCRRLQSVLTPQKRGAKQCTLLAIAIAMMLSAGLLTACAAKDAAQGLADVDAASLGGAPVSVTPQEQASEEKEVPAIIGELEQTVVALLELNGIPYEIVYVDVEEGVQAGTVQSTEPAAGEMVSTAPDAKKLTVLISRPAEATDAATASQLTESRKEQSTQEEICFPLPNYTLISSRFGNGTNGSAHRGTDIVAAQGSPIYAGLSGTVIEAQNHQSLGNTLLIESANGVTLRYAMCDRLLVSQGDNVVAGQQIATVGNTGNATGVHLHLEYSSGGVLRDPADLFPELAAQ